MSDIRKNLTLSAKLDDSQLKKQLEILKKEMGSAFSVDSQSLGELKAQFKDLAKELSSQLKEGVSQGKGGSGGSRRSNVDLVDDKYRAKQHRADIRDQDKLYEREQRQKAKDADREARSKEKNLEKEARAAAKKLAGEEKAQQRALAKEAASKEKERKKDEEAKKREEAKAENSLKKQMAENQAKYGSDYGKTPSDFAASMGKFTKDSFGGGENDNGGRQGRLGKLATGLTMAATVGETYETIQGIRATAAERNNRLSRDLEAGLGVEAISREAGRNNTAAGGFGALAGAGAGALAGAATGTLIGGPIGSILGGLGGAVLGGVKGYYRGQNTEGELNTEQTRLLSDAEARARAISPLRQQMMAGGGITGDTLTDQMKVGARKYGVSAEESLQTMLQARQSLGNEGAAGAFDQILSNQRFLGIGAGTSAQNIETMAGLEGTSRSSAANKQADIIKRGVAAGLDVSKSGKYLQTVTSYLQNSAGLGRTDTEGMTTEFARIAAGLAGGGPVTDVTLQQTQGIAQMLNKESGSLQGLAGAGNITGLQQMSDKFGGFDTGTFLSLANLQKGAKEEDILNILSKNTGGAGKGDLAEQAKAIAGFKNQDIGGQFAQTIAPGNLGTFLSASERGISTQEQLAVSRGAAGQFAPGSMEGAAQALAAPKETITQSAEFKLDVAQFTRSTESAGEGLKTFTTVTEQMTNQMKKLLQDLEAAQKRFNELSRQTSYRTIQSNN